jgi:phosphatidylserine/phosphatidylglycerophosphate/cardiolipin synthase-like enzyme
MRRRKKNNGISAHAISGTYVVIIGMDAIEEARRGLLGFAIHRTDHTEKEAYWLKGFKTFESVEPNPRPGQFFPLYEHPVQSFLWGDYTAKPHHKYTYKIVPIYGKPKKLEEGESAEVTISTESDDDGDQAVYFNRAAAASQAYAQKFKNQKPDEVPDRQAFVWLSRGLEEAILDFINQAKGPEFSIRAAVYEFNYEPVLQAFGKAAEGGVDVKIIYDARQDSPRDATEKAVEKAGIKHLMVARRANKSYIAHNKFIVLLKNGKPIQVWTGSTNFTPGGIFGQANVGHAVRDAQVAKKYLKYWELLVKDVENRKLRPLVEAETPVPSGCPEKGTTIIFSPRSSLKALEWYIERLDTAEQVVALTLAFGVNPSLAAVLGEDKDYLRYLLLEKLGDNYKIYSADPDVLISVGSYLKKDTLYRWAEEILTGFNVHVRYIHTKFMIIDPLTPDPIVITGSANFSDASTKNNDENMLVIRGNQRVADIYLGEFMRLFNHYYFRYHADRLRKLPKDESKKSAFLYENDSWTDRYYDPQSIKRKQRLLFS